VLATAEAAFAFFGPRSRRKGIGDCGYWHAIRLISGRTLVGGTMRSGIAGDCQMERAGFEDIPMTPTVMLDDWIRLYACLVVVALILVAILWLSDWNS
jgi:hypothetical protein